MTRPGGGDTVDSGPSPHRDVRGKGGDPSPDDRQRGETGDPDPAEPLDLDTARERAS